MVTFGNKMVAFENKMVTFENKMVTFLMYTVGIRYTVVIWSNKIFNNLCWNKFFRKQAWVKAWVKQFICGRPFSTATHLTDVAKDRVFVFCGQNFVLKIVEDWAREGDQWKNQNFLKSSEIFLRMVIFGMHSKNLDVTEPVRGQVLKILI